MEGREPVAEFRPLCERDFDFVLFFLAEVSPRGQVVRGSTCSLGRGFNPSAAWEHVAQYQLYIDISRIDIQVN